jgi:hypothetical protein
MSRSCLSGIDICYTLEENDEGFYLQVAPTPFKIQEALALEQNKVAFVPHPALFWR